MFYISILEGSELCLGGAKRSKVPQGDGTLWPARRGFDWGGVSESDRVLHCSHFRLRVTSADFHAFLCGAARRCWTSTSVTSQVVVSDDAWRVNRRDRNRFSVRNRRARPCPSPSGLWPCRWRIPAPSSSATVDEVIKSLVCCTK